MFIGFAEVECQGFIGRMTFNEIYHGKKGNSFKKQEIDLAEHQ